IQLVSLSEHRQVKNHFCRISNAVVLLFSVSVLPLTPLLSSPAAAQAQADSNGPAKADKPISTEPKRPLSTNEDPEQIGKRNINKGFIGWLGGSMEKEMALGRQIAAEVEQQAKMIDDPVVTEYVNRVGQNLECNYGVK